MAQPARAQSADVARRLKQDDPRSLPGRRDGRAEPAGGRAVHDDLRFLGAHGKGDEQQGPGEEGAVHRLFNFIDFHVVDPDGRADEETEPTFCRVGEARGAMPRDHLAIQ